MLSKHAEWTGVLSKVAVEAPAGSWSKIKNYFGSHPEVLVAAGIPFAGAAADAAASAGMGILHRLREAKDKSLSYKAMMEMHPGLSDRPAEKVQRYYNTLYTANPMMAKDPTVAGAWVHQVIELEMPGHPNVGVISQIGEMAKIRQAISGSMKAEHDAHGRGGGLFSEVSKGLVRPVTEGFRDERSEENKKVLQAQAELPDMLSQIQTERSEIEGNRERADVLLRAARAVDSVRGRQAVRRAEASGGVEPGFMDTLRNTLRREGYKKASLLTAVERRV